VKTPGFRLGFVENFLGGSLNLLDDMLYTFFETAEKTGQVPAWMIADMPSSINLAANYLKYCVRVRDLVHGLTDDLYELDVDDDTITYPSYGDEVKYRKKKIDSVEVIKIFEKIRVL
jgi:hypothetical protein